MSPAEIRRPWRVEHTLSSHKGSVHCAVFNHNGSFILTGGQDRKVILWNASKGTLVKAFEKHAYEVLGICATHDNSRFASCGGDRDVLLWDVAEGVVFRRYSGHNGRVNAVAFNDDSSVLVSASFDTTVRLWDTKAQQRMPIQIMQDAKDSITSVVISGTNVVTGCVDGYVRWYDLRMGELQTDYFDMPVTSVTLSADAKTMLVTTLDSTIRLMDKDDGSLLNTYKGHLNKDYRIKSCFTFGEASVLAGDETGRLFEWKLDGDDTVWTNEHVSPGKTLLWTACHPKRAGCIATAGADGAVRVWTNDA